MTVSDTSHADGDTLIDGDTLYDDGTLNDIDTMNYGYTLLYSYTLTAVNTLVDYGTLIYVDTVVDDDILDGDDILLVVDTLIYVFTIVDIDTHCNEWHNKGDGILLHEDQIAVEGSPEALKLEYSVLLCKHRGVRFSPFKCICKIVLQFGSNTDLFELLHTPLHGKISVGFALVDPILLLILARSNLQVESQIRSLN
jgi:hypothetical protein